MGFRIKEVSDMSGVSIRMLRHYDKTGLLKPDDILENGYRDYSKENLDRLQRIMYLKELDFSIPDMLMILEGTECDIAEALRGQEELLVEKKERLEGIINLIRCSLKEGIGDKLTSIMDKFKAFDNKEIEEHKKKYADEAEKKYVSTEAYAQSISRTNKYNSGDWKRITEESEAIYTRFATAMKTGPDSVKAHEAGKEWKGHISKYYYDCTNEIFLGLADMYVADQRFTKNIDKHADGLAAFMSTAMKDYIKKL